MCLNLKLACPECGKEEFTRKDDDFMCVSCGAVVIPEEMPVHVYEGAAANKDRSPFNKVKDFIRASGERFQAWEGEYFFLYITFYESGFANVRMEKKNIHSRFLPECYVFSNTDCLPAAPAIQTTSYGVCSISEIEELSEALRCAVETAKAVNEQFVIPIRNGTFDKGALIPRESEQP